MNDVSEENCDKFCETGLQETHLARERDEVPIGEPRSIAKVRSVTCIGIDAVGIDIEAQIFGALRRFAIVGLPDGALRESRERVRCAIENSGFSFPHQEVIVGLSPASLPKSGAAFDLPIALSILAAAGSVPESEAICRECLIVGELALDGNLKSVPGVLSAALYAKAVGLRSLIVPIENAAEAALIEGISVYPANNLSEAILLIRNGFCVRPYQSRVQIRGDEVLPGPNFGDVIGQYAAKRALEVVAAGRHNLLLIGPPGAGKSMLAQRVTSIIPRLSKEECLEVTRIYSVMRGKMAYSQIVSRTANPLLQERPFRSPHHSISTAGLIGGGNEPLPGEITLAHRGVLFLDELPEFRRDALESLRQPIEAGKVTISRARLRLEFPADFLLIAAMNPCPCGRYGAGGASCECSAILRRKYRAKISSPLLDRIDLQLWLPAVPISQLQQPLPLDPTSEMYSRVALARAAQQNRFQGIRANSNMSSREIREYCALDSASVRLLEQAAAKLKLSARGYARILKVARTIADLEQSKVLHLEHVSEALSYRLSEW